MSTINVDGTFYDIPGVVIQAEAEDIAIYLELEAEVDKAEGDGIMARWEFGRRLADKRRANGGLQLPHGHLDKIVKALAEDANHKGVQKGGIRRELQYRMQFADRYPTEDEVRTAIRTFGDGWHALRASFAADGIRQSTENEWYTPAIYIEAAREVLGGFDLDPASSYSANEVVKAINIYTAEDDGLERPWLGRVWLNPPYGNLPGKFIAKLTEQHSLGNVPKAIALINAHCTDTDWFEPLWDHTLCFTDHRIDFESVGREKTSTSTHGSVFAYLGPDRRRFADVFAEFGPVVRRWP